MHLQHNRPIFPSLHYNHQWLCLQEDAVSASLLSDFDVDVREMFSPREVRGDGNCFYRAVSLGLFGTEDFHFYLRAVTAFHIIDNRQLYDIRSHSFVLAETCIRTACLRNVICSALTDGDYAEMVHLFALSDALHIPMHFYTVYREHTAFQVCTRTPSALKETTSAARRHDRRMNYFSCGLHGNVQRQ